MSLCRYLCVQNPKTIKGEKFGYLSGILHLAPASLSGVNVCAYSTAGCREACLNTAGRGRFARTQKARIRKTKLLFEDRVAFIDQIFADVRSLCRKADRVGLKPCVRLNGTSDLPWLAQAVGPNFPDVQFYDYTAIPKIWERTLPNYHLIYSLKETHESLLAALVTLRRGHNVAVVFDAKKGDPLPQFFYGFKVTDGDLSDLRFLDKPGTVTGVRAKGKAKKDCSGFVQSTLVQIARAA